MTQYSKMPPHNIVRDWNKAQGFTSSQDSTHQIIRDLDIRLVSIQNSSTRPIGIAITNYSLGPDPPIKMFIGPGQTRDLGINSYGSYPQFLWLFDSVTKAIAGKVFCIKNDANWFVLREGLNEFWVQSFRTGTYSAQK